MNFLIFFIKFMNISFLKIFCLHFQKLFLSLFYFLDKIFVGKNCIGKLFKICPETGQNLQQQRRAAKASAQRAAQPAWTRLYFRPKKPDVH